MAGPATRKLAGQVSAVKSVTKHDTMKNDTMIDPC